MTTQDVRIQFVGFKPADPTAHKLEAWAEELHEESPSESSMKATYSRQGKEYRGEIKITSRAGEFFVAARGVNLYAVGRDALKRMRRQLSQWKARRFDGEASPDSPFTAPPSSAAIV